MCGRYELHRNFGILHVYFDAEDFEPQDFRANYNIAPTQSVLTIRPGPGRRQASWMQWGMIPSWAKDRKIAASLINARSETVTEKPSFRAAFKSRRCLIPTDGFFEWKRGGKTKRPFHFHRADGSILAFAGLWERWIGEGAPIESCTILTCEPNDLCAQFHDRMPVILPPDAFGAWLGDSKPEDLKALLKPFPAELMACHEVGAAVGNVRNNSPECIEPI
jgi:putative SOS response-associated peptidase YedK